MKARIPPKIPKQLKQEAERIAKNAYEQIREKEIRTSHAEYLKQCCMLCIRISDLVVTDVQRH